MGDVGSKLDHQLGERILWERKGMGGCGQAGSFEQDAGDENEQRNVTMHDGDHRKLMKRDLRKRLTAYMHDYQVWMSLWPFRKQRILDERSGRWKGDASDATDESDLHELCMKGKRFNRYLAFSSSVDVF